MRRQLFGQNFRVVSYFECEGHFMKMQKVVRKQVLRTLAILCLGISSSFALARVSYATPSEQLGKEQEQNAKAKEARYMMSSQPSSVIGEEKATLTEADFSWSAIAHNGPAAGADPVIGKKSGKPFYDFKDGQPYPYYVTKGQDDSK